MKRKVLTVATLVFTFNSLSALALCGYHTYYSNTLEIWVSALWGMLQLYSLKITAENLA